MKEREREEEEERRNVDPVTRRRDHRNGTQSIRTVRGDACRTRARTRTRTEQEEMHLEQKRVSNC